MKDKKHLLIITEDEEFILLLKEILEGDFTITSLPFDLNALKENVKKGEIHVILDTRENRGIEFYFKIKEDDEINYLPLLCVTSKILPKKFSVQLMVSNLDIKIIYPFESKTFLLKLERLFENTEKWYKFIALKKGIEFKDENILYIVSQLSRFRITGTLLFETPWGKVLIQLNEGRMEKIVSDDVEGEEAIKRISSWDRGKYMLVDDITALKEEKKEEKRKMDEEIPENLNKLLDLLIHEKGVKGIVIVTKEGKKKYRSPENYLGGEAEKIGYLMASFSRNLSQKLNFSSWKACSLETGEVQYILLPYREDIVIIETLPEEPLKYYMNFLNRVK